MVCDCNALQVLSSTFGLPHQAMKQRAYSLVPQSWDQLEQGTAPTDGGLPNTPDGKLSWSPQLSERRGSDSSASSSRHWCLPSACGWCFKPVLICKLRLSPACMLFSFFIVWVSFHVLSQVDLQALGEHRVVLDAQLDAIRALEPPCAALCKKPLMGAVATHHRTGTMLFSYTTGDICQEFGLDFELSDDKVNLPSPNDTATTKYVALDGARQRLMVGMHGYGEDCPEGPEPSVYCGDFDVDCWLQACRLREPGEAEAPIPVVHVVRNPADILVSSYLYHRRGTEEWLQEPNPGALSVLPEDLQRKHAETALYKALQALDVSSGLLVEFHSSAGDIYRGARNHRDLQDKPWALNVRYEDLQKDYDGAMGRVYSHLGLGEMFGRDKLLLVAKKFDLHKMPEEDRHRYAVDAHVTGQEHSTREGIRDVVAGLPDLRVALERLANLTGYAGASFG
ncbi:unnamed protein product [Ostreobium quekettii]|uniref:Sulfotransferase n=1 Tax=Ostreobium quekettii TaxID=121088 RepID=A0A8S1JD36_9CHLO|nr:unnamed protein product [Ostreobium quekettii]|eukprot:evm.model.scf_1629.3 EVM.evm.TU.scf_1629.3   scf_1629:20252-24393(-)